MPLVPINYNPGINKELTKLQNESNYVDADKARFFQGSPQSIGGWLDSSAGNKFVGICRGMKVWQQIDTNINVAVGTNIVLYIWRGGTFFDVTPISKSVTLTNPFTTLQGISIVTVVDASSSPSNGDVINIHGPITVGGVILNGAYLAIIPATPVSGSYTIDAGTPAPSSATGGGTVIVDYYIASGTISGGGTGYGTGTYGQGTWSTPRVAPIIVGTATPTSQNPSTWSLDNFGEDLIANRRSGPIFHWVAAGGLAVRAKPLPAQVVVAGASLDTGAPQAAECILVSTPDRHLIAFGAEKNGVQDLMNVRWSDQENFEGAGSWNATDTNSAGGQRLQGGTRILNAVEVRGGIMIHTDTDLIAMTFTGAPYIFGFFPVGSRCGLIAAKATVEFNGILFWMGDHDFFMYDGVIRVVPCSVRRFIFDSINRAAIGKVHLGVCRDFMEIWVFYPDGHNIECNRYAIFSIIEQTWTTGSMDRSCYNDGGAVGSPLATDSLGALFYQESGTTANGAALTSFVEAGDTTIGQGDHLMFIDRFIPDITQADSDEVSLSLTLRKWPSDRSGFLTGPTASSDLGASVNAVKGPYPVDNLTPWVSFRARARHVAFKLSSNTKWRLGKIRARAQEDGRR